jgi:hypothetical protein
MPHAFSKGELSPSAREEQSSESERSAGSYERHFVVAPVRGESYIHFGLTEARK